MRGIKTTCEQMEVKRQTDRGQTEDREIGRGGGGGGKEEEEEGRERRGEEEHSHKERLKRNGMKV